MPDRYTREDVEAFIHSPGRGPGREGDPPSVGLMNNRLSLLNSFYNYAASYSITGEDGSIEPLMKRMSPTAGLKHMQRERPPYRAMTANELQRFFDAIPKDTVIGLRDRALFLTYFYTARRRSEIVDLRWGDLEYGTIIDGNMRYNSWIYHFRGKGHKRQDDSAELPLPAKVAIDRYLEVSGRKDSIKSEDPIFTAADRRYKSNPPRPLHPNTVWHAVKVYAAKAGLDPRKVTTHSFRHTSARRRFEAGSTIREIQILLRHSTMAVTHLYLEESSAADPGAKLLEKLFEDL